MPPCTTTKLTGTFNVLVVACDASVKKIVFASSSFVYGDTPTLPKKESMCPCPKSPYAVSKHAGEECLQVFSGMLTASMHPILILKGKNKGAFKAGYPL
jgi:UDP-glucose 4-epimerase